MCKLAILIGVIVFSLEVLGHPNSKLVKADDQLNREQPKLTPEQINESYRPRSKPLSPKQVERLATWKKGDDNMWQISGQTEGDMVLIPGQIRSLVRPEPTPLSPEQINRLKSWKKGDKNMWEMSGQTEGDMVLSPQHKNGVKDEIYRWKNKEIPYELDPVFSETEANTIRSAVKEFAAKSCVNVRPKTSDDTDWVTVTGENTGCWSMIGKIGGRQQLNLQKNGCLWPETIVHEFLHAAGFLHQQSATERDEYITVVWQNIEEGQKDNFNKYDSETITHFGTLYDYASVMHYSETAFSVNGSETIIPHDKTWIGKLGKAMEMSKTDVEKLNKMYCNSSDVSAYTGFSCFAIIIAIFSLLY